MHIARLGAGFNVWLSVDEIRDLVDDLEYLNHISISKSLVHQGIRDSFAGSELFPDLATPASPLSLFVDDGKGS